MTDNVPARLTPAELIGKHRDDFASVMPSHTKPSSWVRLAQGALRRDEKLAKAAAANPGSLMSTLLDAARLGLEPGSEEYYLVPFGNEVTGIIGYQGEIELIYRAGAVTSIKCEIVHAADHFIYDSSMDRPEHKPDWFGDRGEMVGVYAYAVMANGATSRIVVLSKSDVERAKAVSRSASSGASPWAKWPEAMWRKTAIHELSKWVPTSAEFRLEQRADAVAVTEARHGSARVNVETGEVTDVIEAEIVTEAGDPR